MTTRRRRRDPFTRTVVRLPERDLAESVLHLAAPLIEPLGTSPPADAVRRAIAMAVDVWNAHVAASGYWGDPKPKALTALRRSMCGRGAPPGLAETFELLSARWRADFSLDPRLVEGWSMEIDESGALRLACEMGLPDGVYAEVPPPVEKRIAVGGRFLDEVQIRLDRRSYLSFPVDNHRGRVDDDGVVTIDTKMPTALQLFAEGHLSRVDGPPVDVNVGGRRLGPMVLSSLSCNGGHHDLATLVFRPATRLR